MKINKVSQYCAESVYDVGVLGGTVAVYFDKLKAVDTSFATATTKASTDVAIVTVSKHVGAKFGRTVSVVSNTAATNQKVYVRGYDYLMQPMTEEFTLNGTTAVAGVKAFFIVEEVELSAGAAQTVTVKTTLTLGLPYRIVKLLGAVLNGSNVASLPQLTAPVNTAQTATSSDPRGLVTIASISDDDDIVLVGIADKSTFVDNDGESIGGGLQGIPHYFA